MSNLKKVLSAGLASTMIMGMMATASATAYEDLTDKSEIKHTEAVNTMVSLGVVSGKDNGAFDPNGSLTRAEACTLIARMLGGGKDPVLGSNVKSNFKDTQGHWAEKYIAYCANLGIIAGKGDGNFDPNGSLTGSAAAKIILCALGYKPEFEGIGGANWELATNTLATKIDLYDGLEDLNPSAIISRDDVSQLIYNGVQAQEVEYRNLQGDHSSTLYATEHGTMLANRFGVVKVEGVVAANETFGLSNGEGATLAGKTKLVDTQEYTYGGRTYDLDGIYPIAISSDLMGQRVVLYVKFNNNLSPNASSSTVLGEPIVSDKTTVVETTKRLKNADKVRDALKGTGLSVVSSTKGVAYDAAGEKATVSSATGIQNTAGVRQRFIDNNDDGKVDVIISETAALSKVSAYKEKDEKLTLSGIGSVDFADIADATSVKKDDYVLVTKYDDTYVLTKAEVVEGKVASFKNDSDGKHSITVDGTSYVWGAGANKTTDLDDDTNVSSDMVDDTYQLYLDAYGNILAVKAVDEAIGNYAIVTASKGDDTTGFATGSVKLTMADGTEGTYDVDLLASAKKWDSSVNTGSNSAKEEAMARKLNGSLEDTLVSYTLNSDKKTVVIGKPDYINADKYEEKSGTPSTKDGRTNDLISSISSYTIDSTVIKMDNSTVFFIKDQKGNYSVVVGLSKLPSKGVDVSGDVDVIYDESGSANVAKAVFAETSNQTYASNADYFFVTGNYSQSKVDGDNVYSYPVVFEDGKTGTIKTKDTIDLAENMVYAYNIDSKGYATDFDAEADIVNNAFVHEVGSNGVSLWDANDYGTNAINADSSYPLAKDAKVWNVEDDANVYDDSLTKGAVVALVLNDDGEIKTAFISDVRDSADEDSMTASVNAELTLTGSLAGDLTGLTSAAVGDTVAVKYTATAAQKVSITISGKGVNKVEDKTGTGTEATTDAYTLVAGDIDKDLTITVKVTEKNKLTRTATYLVSVKA